MLSGVRTKLGNEVRIGQEAHVEHQVGVLGHAFAITKAHARDENVLVAITCLKSLDQRCTQLVNVELCGVQEEHRCLEQAAQGGQDLRQLVQPRAFADVHHQRRPLNLQRVEYEFGKVGDQSHGKVVHAVVAEVL